MKKALSIFFATFYLAISSGFAFNVHYCGGKVESVNLLAEAEKCCCGEEEEMIECCSNASFFIQLDAEQKANETFRFHLEDFISATPEVSVGSFSFAVAEEPNYGHLDLPPPEKKPLWLLNCSFVFYG